jgi:hypothetical protein
MNEILFVVKEAPEGGLTARALGESIFTEADDMESLRQKVRDAVHCHFEEGKLPKIILQTLSCYPLRLRSGQALIRA